MWSTLLRHRCITLALVDGGGPGLLTFSRVIGGGRRTQGSTEVVAEATALLALRSAGADARIADTSGRMWSSTLLNIRRDYKVMKRIRESASVNESTPI
jgi:hypothetical protein